MTLLYCCSGRPVSLPNGQMDNSDVGHTHIGTRRYVPQDFFKVNDGSFFTSPVLCRTVDLAKEKDNALDIMGLLSPGGVHSREEQILELIELADRACEISQATTSSTFNSFDRNRNPRRLFQV
jgi:2,3-bisphosphoglycerate-independent phosphoglycerate mutase